MVPFVEDPVADCALDPATPMRARLLPRRLLISSCRSTSFQT
jgi:hypothetical protein